MEKPVRFVLALSSLIVVTFLFVLFLVFIVPNLIGYSVEDSGGQVQFYFFDESEGLEGYVFSGDKLIGKTSDGYFNLSYENYQDNLNLEKNLSLFGKLENGLYFDKYWGSFEIKRYYFEGESVFNFEAKIDLNNPSRRDLSGFIQPENVKEELKEIELKKKVIEDLSLINDYLNEKITYVEDWEFNKENYWQEPSETVTLGQGDCEDYSTTLLSLFLAYEPSLNCYNIIFSSHVTTFCKIDEEYIYYDQGKTELRKEIEWYSDVNVQLEELKEEYFEDYGIDESERAHYSFNENSFFEFESEENFIKWQATLSEKEEFDLFGKLDEEVEDIESKYPTIKSIGEFRTEKVFKSTPSLKGFFLGNWIIIVFIVILIVLVGVLIKIKKK